MAQEKSTKYILMFGACAKEWVRFASGLCSIRNTVMVYDASYTREIFLTTVFRPDGVAETAETTVRLRDKIFTTDLKYMLAEGSRFDLVLIYDDFSQCGCYAEYESRLDYAYVCCNGDQYSIMKMNEFCDKAALNAHFPFSFVFDGREKDADKFQVLEHWRYLTTRRRKEDNRFFIPHSDSDHSAFLLLEYGKFCFGKLSPPLQALLLDIAKQLAGEDREMIIPMETVCGV